MAWKPSSNSSLEFPPELITYATRVGEEDADAVTTLLGAAGVDPGVPFSARPAGIGGSNQAISLENDRDRAATVGITSLGQRHSLANMSVRR
jgi:hypothetical protein